MQAYRLLQRTHDLAGSFKTLYGVWAQTLEEHAAAAKAENLHDLAQQLLAQAGMTHRYSYTYIHTPLPAGSVYIVVVC